MSKRKGSTPRRRDNDYDRNDRLLVARDSSSSSSSTTGTRQLFDPRSDNPLEFNKQHTRNEDKEPREKKPQPRQLFMAPKEPSGDKTTARRPPVSGRRLWSAEDSSSTTEQKGVEGKSAPARAASNKRFINKNSNVSESAHIDNSKREKPKSKSLAAPTVLAIPAEKDEKKDLERKRIKSLIVSLHTIEAKLESLTTSSQTMACFLDQSKEAQQKALSSRRDLSGEDRKVNTQEYLELSDDDLADAERIWKDRIHLHLSLSEKYLDILKCDFEYAEKKGLESLCWKRAVYSLVDQFRKALKKSASDITALNNLATSPSKAQSELASMLFEDDEIMENSLIAEVPVIHEGGGMTFTKVEKPKPAESKQINSSMYINYSRAMLGMFLQYLDLADAFYLKLTLFLKSTENEPDDDLDAYLNQWRRTKKYRWYTCIPLRGDLARYRWAYTPESDDFSAELEDSVLQEPVTNWTKEEAFNDAWKRYLLGTWLMPARGNLYFNLSLLLQQPPHLHMQGQDLHKLYFSTRSLMVRRNGFLNARESMLALFEGNRRWVHKHIEPSSSNSRSKSKSKKSKASAASAELDKNTIIPALFIRLHGLLFTKIGLDEFPRFKRVFFDTLFDINHTKSKKDGLGKLIVLNNESQKPVVHDSKNLSEIHVFWLETAILCLSSLYSYDFANAKLTKLLTTNSAKRFHLETSDETLYQQLTEEIGESVLFSYGIDLTCQIAVELLQRFLDPLLPDPSVPILPKLPNVSLSFKDNLDFLFGPVMDADGKRIHKKPEEELPEETDPYAWLVYIEILLHWMVLNGVCLRSKDQVSLWETLVGDIGYDFIFPQGKRLTAANDNRSSKISPAFWPLLLQFLNRLLSELSTDDKYDMVNKHLLEEEDKNEDVPDLEYAFTKNIISILGNEPDLPEESLLRGLGWVDEIHGRFLRVEPNDKPTPRSIAKTNTVARRKLKILDYGFTLVKHLDDILYYDPVEEIFTVSKTVEERAFALVNEVATIPQTNKQIIDGLYEDEEEDEEENEENSSLKVGTTIAEMDDDVLLSNETDFDEQYDGDDIVTQLKKRREQLQSIVASTEAEERFGYRRLPARAKEREARLSYLRDCIIPGKTILVLDTNCFIGHIDHVKKLFQSQKWSIIVPLVVVTELDGLRTNTHKLGLVAQQSIELLETTLASKPKQSTLLRIQTSHNNFMNDISIRSEQFVFGETDKNLDDLILSSCLWWNAQQGLRDENDKTVPVCLVTGDRNLSVKARARDVEVVPVSAIIQLTPK